VDAADLKAARTRLGLSLAQLAERLDIPKDTLSRWELAKLPIRHDELLSRALNDLEREMKTYSIVGNNRIVFNIAGNKYRLIVAFAYRTQIAYIKFVGTHAEYDKIDAASVDQS
jgi:mRNA-degrading endonuclease HigB of HigAB toxin-antitoxin module